MKIPNKKELEDMCCIYAVLTDSQAHEDPPDFAAATQLFLSWLRDCCDSPRLYEEGCETTLRRLLEDAHRLIGTTSMPQKVFDHLFLTLLECCEKGQIGDVTFSFN